MKFFTAFDFFVSIIISITTGALLGCIYKASESILLSVKRSLFLFVDIFSALSDNSKKSILNKMTPIRKIKMSPLLRNIFEGLIFLMFGIIFILLLYVLLDGVFRFYVLFITLLFFVFSKNTFGRAFSMGFEWVYSKIYSALFTLLYIVLLPIYKLLCLFERLIKKFTDPIKKKAENLSSKKITERKITEVDNFFKKITKK